MNITTILGYLFPNGTIKEELFFADTLNEERKRNLQSEKFTICPFWPTDVFTFCATVLEKIGVLHFEPNTEEDRENLSLTNLKKISGEWVLLPPQKIQESWHFIVNNSALSMEEVVKNEKNILFHIHFLFRCADETSNGIGWSGCSSLFGLGLVNTATEDWSKVKSKFMRGLLELPFFPNSICQMIPPYRAVCAPKSICAEVGYTIRSLSHHLALLDVQPKIKFTWNIVEASKAVDEEAGTDRDHFNIVFIPYPFTVNSNCISPSRKKPKPLGISGRKFGYFEVIPTWLPKGKNAEEIAQDLYENIVKPLLTDARKHVDVVDCILFPEGALTDAVATALFKVLVKNERDQNPNFFISGAIPFEEKCVDQQKTNQALFFHSDNIKTYIKHSQEKHHRWKLSIEQIRRYGLSSFPADDRTDWWEDIDVSVRTLPFYAIRKHSCMTVLICEDLARSDPALPAIRAIGPNLVIALLMDGPQLITRWSGRYATVLADDPGCAVLSVTSVAMVDRSNKHEKNGERSVALWKHHSGRTEQISLPKDAKGLLLALASTKVEQVTMDNRADGEETRRFELMGYDPLYLNKSDS